MIEFATCGKITYADDKPVAYAQFAPSERPANRDYYESHPISKLEEGVVFLSCLYVVDKESRRARALEYRQNIAKMVLGG
jgi:hypothetical protein